MTTHQPGDTVQRGRLGRRLHRGGPPVKPITHGTDYGYQMHRARGEQACRDCLDAHAEAGRRRRRADPAYKAAGKRRYVHSKLLAEFRDAAPDWYARLSKKYGAEWDAAHQTKETP